MLIMQRRTTDRICIGDHLVITVMATRTGRSVVLQIGKCQHELAVGYTAEIEPGVTIKLFDVRGGDARIGVHAPKHIPVDRSEYREWKQRQEAARKRASMPERVGIAMCGLFLSLSAVPAWLLASQIAGVL